MRIEPVRLKETPEVGPVRRTPKPDRREEPPPRDPRKREPRREPPPDDGVHVDRLA